jgi:hypothetical protein
VLKNAATEEQAQAVLDFACGRVSCAPIGWGGAKEFPNTRVDHAAWAIDRYFRLRSREPDAFPQRDCHFVGVATLDVPNNFYLASNGELVQTNHRTDVIARKVTVPSEGIVFNSGNVGERAVGIERRVGRSAEAGGGCFHRVQVLGRSESCRCGRRRVHGGDDGGLRLRRGRRG